MVRDNEKLVSDRRSDPQSGQHPRKRSSEGFGMSELEKPLSWRGLEPNFGTTVVYRHPLRKRLTAADTAGAQAEATTTLTNTAEGLEDSLQFYGFPEFDQKKVASTNVVERLFREVRRRSRVVGVFPSSEAYVRLLSCYLIEYSEGWVTERSYIRKKAIEATKARLTKAA
jgi:hypothetical protein